MPELINKFLRQFNNFWSGSSLSQKMKLGLVTIIAIISLIMLFIITSRPEYVPLFTNMTYSDAGDVITKLEGIKTPYKISDEGTTILVPAKEVYKTRIQLANEGLPKGGTVGFSDILESTKLGTTDWERQIQYIHALQGELTRTIKGINSVEDARVHIVLPKKSLFIDPESKDTARAAISLKMRPGAGITGEQVRGIIHLVSNSVEGLSTENVIVIDEDGRILSNEMTGTELTQTEYLKHQMSIQMEFKKSLEKSVQTLLEYIFGPGNVAVRATVQMNFDKKYVEKRLFEPVLNEEGIIRSIQELEEYFSGTGNGAEGVPGVEENIGLTYQDKNQETSAYEKREEIRNYEINEINENLEAAPGSIENLSVAVVVNRDLTDDEKIRISNLVESAVGFKPERDTVTVEGIIFDFSLQEEMSKEMELHREQRELMIKRGLLIGAGLLGFMLIFYNRWIAAKRKREEGMVFVPRELSAGAVDLIEEKDPTLKDIEKLVKRKPDNVAQLLRTWLIED